MITREAVLLDDVHKQFVTRHFFHVDEDTRQRRWYNRRVVEAARGISFGIAAGEIFGLLGPNGAGKTTTVKMISGLVRPDRGRVFVAGYEVESQRKRVLERIGVVLEGSRTTMWPLTPLENLRYYGNLRSMYGRRLHDRSHDLLDFIGLKDKKNVQVRYLSRGQKQKLAICVALISDPQVLLLDEPTTGLDVESSRMIKDRLIDLAREQGKTVLVTTHDMHVAQELCDRIGIIHHGQLIACRPTSELLSLFSGQVYVFEVDRFPEGVALEGIEGLVSWSAQTAEGDGHGIEVQLVEDEAARSAALYQVVDRLRAAGCLLRGVQQRRPNLESVFLRLTSSAPAPPREGAA
jgi:ABC-2 type transport system ATP-binding protein